MILHVTFTNGSNPWVSLPTDRHTVAKLWRRWMKNHPDTAQPKAHVWGVGFCEPLANNRGYLVHIHGPANYSKHYLTLGKALAELEKWDLG